MKKTVVGILCLFVFAKSGTSQSLPELIKLYEDYCNETILDTIDQNGMVYERIGPVFQKDSVVGFAGIGVFDTIWKDIYCPSYKEEKYSYIYHDTSIIINLDDLVGYRYDQTPVYRPRLQPVDKIFIKEVKKKYVCTVRRREIVPFDENFWQWIKSR